MAIVTSLIGAFLVSYFSGFALKLLQNLGDIVERYKAGGALEPADYVFFSLFIVLAILGMIVQMKTIKKDNEEEQIMTTDRLLEIWELIMLHH